MGRVIACVAAPFINTYVPHIQRDMVHNAKGLPVNDASNAVGSGSGQIGEGTTGPREVGTGVNTGTRSAGLRYDDRPVPVPNPVENPGLPVNTAWYPAFAPLEPGGPDDFGAVMPDGGGRHPGIQSQFSDMEQYPGLFAPLNEYYGMSLHRQD